MAGMKQFQHLGWGRGVNGQLGLVDEDESRERRPQPKVQAVPASGLICGDAVLTLCCGADFTLLLTIHGDVWSCGGNEHGQLGYSSLSGVQAKPRAALKGAGIIRLACGSAHAVAVSAGSEMHAWGLNSSGQLGLGHKRTISPMAAQVVAHVKRPKKPVVLTALLGPSGAKKQPKLVPNERGVVGWQETACGDAHTIGAFLFEPGGRLAIYSWGRGDAGALGLGDTDERLTPTAIPGVEPLDVVQIACGLRHTVLLTRDQSVYTFGFTGDGRLGLPFLRQGERPPDAPKLDDPVLALRDDHPDRISASEGGEAAKRRAAGLIKPRGARGQRKPEAKAEGDGEEEATEEPEPKPVASGGMDSYKSRVKQMQRTTSVRKQAGGSSGGGAAAAQGSGAKLVRTRSAVEMEIESRSAVLESRNSVFRLHSKEGVAAEEAAKLHALRQSRQVYLEHDQFRLLKPTCVAALEGHKIVQVACGAAHTVALSADREIWAWGSGAFGQLGAGRGVGSPTPVRVEQWKEAHGKSVIWVGCGEHFTIALTCNGQVLVVGANDECQVHEGRHPSLDPTLSNPHASCG
eukprot:2046004-Prymnesium_polylepis.2